MQSSAPPESRYPKSTDSDINVLATSLESDTDPEQLAVTFLDHLDRALGTDHLALWMRYKENDDEPGSFLQVAQKGDTPALPMSIQEVLEASYAYALNEKSVSSQAGSVFRLQEVKGYFIAFQGDPHWLLVLHMPGETLENDSLPGPAMKQLIGDFFLTMNRSIALFEQKPNEERPVSSSAREKKDATASVSRLKRMLNRMNTATFFEDGQRKVVTVNNKLLELFSLDAAETDFEGSSVNQLLRQLLDQVPDREEILEWADGVRTEKENAVFDPIQLKNGRVLEISLQPFVNEEQYDGMLWRFTELLATSDLPAFQLDVAYDQIVEPAADLIISCNLRGYITYANDSVSECLGLEKQDLLGRHFIGYVSPDFRKAIWSLYAKQFENRLHSTYFEFPLITPGGDEIWLGQQVHLLVDEETVTGYTAIARKINGWKDVESAMVQSNQRFQDLFQLSRDAILLMDLDCEVKECNASATQLFGLSTKDNKSLSFLSLLAESGVDQFRQGMKVLQEHGVMDMEVELKRIEGPLFTAFLSGSLLYLNDERVVQVLIQEKDERNANGERLSEPNLFYTQLLDAIPGQPVIYDAEARYKYFGRLGNLSEEDCTWLIGKTDAEWCARSGIKEAVGRRRKEFVLLVFETGEAIKFEESYSSEDGAWVIQERQLTPIFDENSKVVGVVGSSVDLKKQKELANKFRLSEDYHRAIKDGSMDGIITIDQDGMLVDFNPATAKIFGWKPNEVLGKELADLMIPAKFREAHRKGIKNFLQTGKGLLLGKRFEFPALRVDGTEIPVDLLIRPVRLGERQVFTAFVRDISERRQSEEQLREARKRARHTLEANERFLANMSHEMRNSLNNVVGMASQLDKTTLNSEQVKYLHAIKFSAENLLLISNDLLDYVKLKKGEIRFESVAFRVKDVLQDLLQIISYRAKEKSLKIYAKKDTQISEYLIGDPYRLNQILFNLLSNAIKFTQEGSITIASELAHEEKGWQWIQFSVIDTGVGIPEDKLKSVFESFTQYSGQVYRKFGGTGLGLTIVKELVQQQKGKISTPISSDKGTTFRFLLPYKIPDESTLNTMFYDSELKAEN